MKLVIKTQLELDEIIARLTLPVQYPTLTVPYGVNLVFPEGYATSVLSDQERNSLLTIYQGYQLPQLPIGTQPQLRSMRAVQFDVEEVEKLLTTDYDLVAEIETAENVKKLD